MMDGPQSFVYHSKRDEPPHAVLEINVNSMKGGTPIIIRVGLGEHGTSEGDTFSFNFELSSDEQMILAQELRDRANAKDERLRILRSLDISAFVSPSTSSTVSSPGGRVESLVYKSLQALFSETTDLGSDMVFGDRKEHSEHRSGSGSAVFENREIKSVLIHHLNNLNVLRRGLSDSTFGQEVERSLISSLQCRGGYGNNGEESISLELPTTDGAPASGVPRRQDNKWSMDPNSFEQAFKRDVVRMQQGTEIYFSGANIPVPPFSLDEVKRVFVFGIVVDNSNNSSSCPWTTDEMKEIFTHEDSLRHFSEKQYRSDHEKKMIVETDSDEEKEQEEQEEEQEDLKGQPPPNKRQRIKSSSSTSSSSSSSEPKILIETKGWNRINMQIMMFRTIQHAYKHWVGTEEETNHKDVYEEAGSDDDDYYNPYGRNSEPKKEKKYWGIPLSILLRHAKIVAGQHFAVAPKPCPASNDYLRHDYSPTPSNLFVEEVQAKKQQEDEKTEHKAATINDIVLGRLLIPDEKFMWTDVNGYSRNVPICGNGACFTTTQAGYKGRDFAGRIFLWNSNGDMIEKQKLTHEFWGTSNGEFLSSAFQMLWIEADRRIKGWDLSTPLGTFSHEAGAPTTRPLPKYVLNLKAGGDVELPERIETEEHVKERERRKEFSGSSHSAMLQVGARGQRLLHLSPNGLVREFDLESDAVVNYSVQRRMYSLNEEWDACMSENGWDKKDVVKMDSWMDDSGAAEVSAGVGVSKVWYTDLFPPAHVGYLNASPGSDFASFLWPSTSTPKASSASSSSVPNSGINSVSGTLMVFCQEVFGYSKLQNHEILLVDEELRVLGRLFGHAEQSKVVLNPGFIDGRTFCSNSHQCVKIWDMRMAKAAMTVLDSSVDWSTPMSVPSSEGGEGYFMATSHDNGIGTRVWDLRNIRHVYNADSNVAAHARPLYTMPLEGKGGLAWHADASQLIFGDGNVCMYGRKDQYGWNVIDPTKKYCYDPWKKLSKKGRESSGGGGCAVM